jgi:hypothetical protein
LVQALPCQNEICGGPWTPAFCCVARSSGDAVNVRSEFWGHLTEALRTGLPQSEIKGHAPDDSVVIRTYAASTGAPVSSNGMIEWDEVQLLVP